MKAAGIVELDKYGKPVKPKKKKKKPVKGIKYICGIKVKHKGHFQLFVRSVVTFTSMLSTLLVVFYGIDLWHKVLTVAMQTVGFMSLFHQFKTNKIVNFKVWLH